MLTHALKSTRHSAGRYEVTYRGRFFTVETQRYRCEAAGDPWDGEASWCLIECEDNCFVIGWGGDGYWNHFRTKWQALQAIRMECDADAKIGNSETSA